MGKVNIISKINNPISVKVPYLNFAREWPRQETQVAVEMEILEQLMQDPGFKYMIDEGMLYIEDMEVKKELNIEPEDAEEPVNIIVLSDAERNKYLKVYDFKKFEEEVKKLPHEQIIQLANFAIEKRITDYDKAKLIKELCGKDIIQAVRLSDLDKED